MSRGFTIKETDVYRLILEELNNNAFSSKLSFSMADWVMGVDSEGQPNGLLINKLALTKNDLSRFDIKETFSESTYMTTETPFVAFSVGPLNGEFIALPTIKDVVYDPTLTFLVCADNINVQRMITLALEEIRYRLIQYERVWNASYMDLDNLASTTKVTETLKVIITSGTIDYGDIIQINGKQYLTYTLPLTIRMTNFGEFANQQKIYLGTSDILETGSTKMFLLEPDEWHWGTARGTESVMFLPDLASAGSTNNKEIKSVVKNKGFSFTLDLQLDLYDSTVGELHKWLYKDSIQEKLVEPIMTLKVEFYRYNSVSETFVIDSDLTTTRTMALTQNQPNESMSKGDKLVHTLVLTPIYNS
jgi:hypothetical protein